MCQNTYLRSAVTLCMSFRPHSARSIGLLRPLKDVTVTAGETATFECELSYEGIAVDWFLGGQKMEAGERVGPVWTDFTDVLDLSCIKLSQVLIHKL